MDPRSPESTHGDETVVVSADFNDVRERLTHRLWRVLLCILIATLDIVAAYRLSKKMFARGFFYSLNAELTCELRGAKRRRSESG